MNNRKRNVIIGIILILLVVLLGAIVGTSIATKNRKNKINKNKSKWKTEAVISPEKGSLQPAGYITINWKSADKMGRVHKYQIYVDDKKQGEVSGNMTTFEYYTTKVSIHKVYIKAILDHGNEVNSDVFGFYVNKKGFCMNKDMAEHVNADHWNVSWYYNWALSKHNYTSFQKLQFVPMFWTTAPTDKDQAEVLKLRGYKYVLAFNEPDRADQSNMSVDDAVNGMKSILNQGLIVGSPAASVWPSASEEWFQPFMKKMKQEKMDDDMAFLALHHYWNWHTKEGAEAFLKIVDETWEMYKKPIWITEFALSGVPAWTKQTRQYAIDYMKIVLPELDKRDYVERYAWFSFEPTDYKNGGSSLINSYKGKITQLGYEYQKLGVPEGYGKKGQVLQEKNPNDDIIK